MNLEEFEKLKPEDIIDQIENDTSNFRWNRSDAYLALFRIYTRTGEKEKAEDAKMDSLVFELATRRYPDRRFLSKYGGTLSNGQKFEHPDLEKDFPEESIVYYKKRAETTNNPLLKARYSDFIWESKKEIKYARIAIRAYLDCCPIYYGNEWMHKLVDSLNRALTIAAQISDEGLIEECSSKHIEFCNALVKANNYRYLIEIIDSILEREKQLKTLTDYDYLSSIIESAIEYYAKNKTDSYGLQRSFVELIEKIWVARKNDDKRKEARVRIAELFIEEANWKKVHYPSGFGVAASLYTRALKEYIDLGGFPDKVTELKIKIREANKISVEREFTKISSKVQIPTEKIDKWLNNYKGQDIQNIFSFMCGDINLWASYSKAEEATIEQAKKAILTTMASVQLMRGDLCISHITEEKEIKEYHTITNFRHSYKIIADVILSKLFQLIENEYPDYPQKLCEYFGSGNIISENRLNIIKHGIRAFENKEYLASIHILIFQIEGILRDLLGRLGVPTFTYRNNEMSERALSDILSALYQVPGIEKDFLKLIEILLNERKGDNLRNEVAHGLLHEKEFNKEVAQLLLLILIKLASYRVTPKAPTETKDKDTPEVPA